MKTSLLPTKRLGNLTYEDLILLQGHFDTFSVSRTVRGLLWQDGYTGEGIYKASWESRWMEDMLVVMDAADLKGKCIIDWRPKGTGPVELAYGPNGTSVLPQWNL